MVVCLEQGADCLHMVQLMPLHPETLSCPVSFKSRLVLPFWYGLTHIVLEKRPLNGSTVTVLHAKGNRHCDAYESSIRGVSRISQWPVGQNMYLVSLDFDDMLKLFVGGWFA